VCVTSDHSLLSDEGKEVRPVDVKVGDKLLHSELPLTETYDDADNLIKNCPYSMGLFFSDGSLDFSWMIRHPEREILETAKKELDAFYQNIVSFEIYESDNGQFELVSSNTSIDNDWVKHLYTSGWEKCIPVGLMNASVETIKTFIDGYYEGDSGDGCMNAISAARFIWLGNRVGYSIRIGDIEYRDYYMICTFDPTLSSTPATAIRSIENLRSTPKYVYDLETDNHHFAAGVGKLVVHNTDSVFSMFDVSHLPASQPHRVAYCTVVAAYVAGQVTQYLRRNNPFKPMDKQWMELQYEKTYRFWLLFSKKRYAGEMTEFNPYHFTDDQKGVASKRRDFCNYVKEIYGKILKSLFDPRPDITRDERINNALSVVRKAIEDLLNNRVPFDKLVISKLLKDQYKVLKHSQSKASKLCDFTADNVFVDDLIIFRCGGIDCQAVVLQKRAANMFSGAATIKLTTPLTVKILETTATDRSGLQAGSLMDIQYGDIIERSASVITLEKILDPKTTDKVLEPIKHPHVRLTRRMFLRDPATAPKSGSRVPYVFCESKTKVLQYMRAEDPVYAKEHNLVVDPEYYLKKQCENAWAQILDTACPGISTKIFNEAYAEYAKKSMRQPDIKSFIGGTHKQKMLSIELSKDSGGNAPKAPAAPIMNSSISSFFGGSKTPVKLSAAPTKRAPVKAVKAAVKAAVKEPVKAAVRAPPKTKAVPPKAKQATIAFAPAKPKPKV
jgi:hypothetical protein